MMASTSATVFVVDDEETIASTLAAILKLRGFKSRYFTHPSLALEAAEQSPPDLFISDVMMPEMTGVELAIRVKAIAPKSRILLFSGQAATVDLLAQARQDGHEFELLTKPFTRQNFLQGFKAEREAFSYPWC